MNLLVRIRGPLACFTRPEFKAERVSYEVITPSAARGVLEAVLWKPQMRWVVEQVTALAPIRFISVRRNEVGSKVPSTAGTWAARNEGGNEFFADDDRQQRMSLLLRDVDYLVRARIELTPKAEPPGDSVVKYEEMFRRRAERGQQFHQPYLGCREFPATVTLAQGLEQPCRELAEQGEVDLGLMLQDIRYGESARSPHFFHAVMRRGVIAIPPLGMPAQPRSGAEDREPKARKKPRSKKGGPTSGKGRHQ